MKHLLYCDRLKVWLFVTISMQAYHDSFLCLCICSLLYRFRFGFTLYKRACLKHTCSFVKPIWNEVSRTKDSILNVSWERNMKHYSLYGNWTVEPRHNDPLIKGLDVTDDFLYPSNTKMYGKEPPRNFVTFAISLELRDI